MKNIKVFEQFDKNKFLIAQKLKKAAKKRLDDRKAEIAKIELTDEEIIEILIGIKDKKCDILANSDKIKKLQYMGLVREPRGVEVQSSISCHFYLTDKGEKLIKNHIGKL